MDGVLKSKKYAAMLATWCIALVCAGTLFGCAQGSNPDTADSAEDAATITVSIDIDSSRATDQGYDESLFSGDVEIPEGSTVQDALIETGVEIDDSAGYVNGIGGLAAGTNDYPNSGWLYYVDGESPTVSSEEYELKGGEKILWVYTPDFNEDAGLSAA